jgi:hypothetical protein
MRAMILAAIILAGCVPFETWEWRSTTLQGKRCFHNCNASGHACKAYCHGSWACVFECGMAVDECRAGCPDMVRAKVVPEVRDDMDCWRFGLCGRGECVADHGRCVRR